MFQISLDIYIMFSSHQHHLFQLFSAYAVYKVLGMKWLHDYARELAGLVIIALSSLVKSVMALCNGMIIFSPACA